MFYFFVQHNYCIAVIAGEKASRITQSQDVHKLKLFYHLSDIHSVFLRNYRVRVETAKLKHLQSAELVCYRCYRNVILLLLPYLV